MTDQQRITLLIQRNATLRNLCEQAVNAYIQGDEIEQSDAIRKMQEILKNPTYTPAPEAPATCIKLWAWRDSPDEYSTLSDHGGDEDWVFLLPKDAQIPMILRTYDGDYIEGFGHTGRYLLPNGDVVLIFAHA